MNIQADSVYQVITFEGLPVLQVEGNSIGFPKICERRWP